MRCDATSHFVSSCLLVVSKTDGSTTNSLKASNIWKYFVVFKYCMCLLLMLLLLTVMVMAVGTNSTKWWLWWRLSRQHDNNCYIISRRCSRFNRSHLSVSSRQVNFITHFFSVTSICKLNNSVINADLSLHPEPPPHPDIQTIYLFQSIIFIYVWVSISAITLYFSFATVNLPANGVINVWRSCMVREC